MLYASPAGAELLFAWCILRVNNAYLNILIGGIGRLVQCRCGWALLFHITLEHHWDNHYEWSSSSLACSQGDVRSPYSDGVGVAVPLLRIESIYET
jgi:hypothetical protein